MVSALRSRTRLEPSDGAGWQGSSRHGGRSALKVGAKTLTGGSSVGPDLRAAWVDPVGPSPGLGACRPGPFAATHVPMPAPEGLTETAKRWPKSIPEGRSTKILKSVAGLGRDSSAHTVLGSTIWGL